MIDSLQRRSELILKTLFCRVFSSDVNCKCRPHFRSVVNKLDLKGQLLQNLGKVDRTADDIFDEHLQNFTRQQNAANKLQKEFNNYIRCIRATLSRGICVTIWWLLARVVRSGLLELGAESASIRRISVKRNYVHYDANFQPHSRLVKRNYKHPPSPAHSLRRFTASLPLDSLFVSGASVGVLKFARKGDAIFSRNRFASGFPCIGTRRLLCNGIVSFN
ncbi:unnamed protein product [Bemisia tabaci]|uniref:BAR domain-containing protein n=1 Tax=Bemisia tabaci TaxID=7038 RepID=A0A9P0ADM0_BEMTA|nr:unnamed protein product [Bemisia tabaci]